MCQRATAPQQVAGRPTTCAPNQPWAGNSASATGAVPRVGARRRKALRNAPRGESPDVRRTAFIAKNPHHDRAAAIRARRPDPASGGALGSYQAGVYQALAEAGLHPDWVAGISIGAINSALIAGNPAEKRVERLRQFWELVSTSPFGIPDIGTIAGEDDFSRIIINRTRSLGALLGGAPGFFTPRVPPPYLNPDGSAAALSYYMSRHSKRRLNGSSISICSMLA